MLSVKRNRPEVAKNTILGVYACPYLQHADGDETREHSNAWVPDCSVKFTFPLVHSSPPPLRQPLLLIHGPTINSHHRLSQVHAHLRQNLGIPEVRNRLHNRLGPLRRIPRLENPTPYKHAITPQLHHERRIRGRRHAPRREVDNRQPPQLRRLLQQLVRRADLLGQHAQLLGRHAGRATDFGVHGPHVAHGFNDVAGPGLAFGADHGGAFGDAAEGFAQVAAAAHEGNAEGVFLDVVGCVGWGEDFGLVYVVYAEGFEDLGAQLLSNSFSLLGGGGGVESPKEGMQEDGNGYGEPPT